MKYKRWKIEEDEFIRNRYPLEGSKDLSLELERNEHSIVDRAYRLKIKKIIVRRRSFCEGCNKEIFNNGYASRAKCCRKCGAKKNYKKRGIFTHHSGRLFSKKEIDILKRYYPNSRKNKLFKLLGRSWCSIQHKANRLSLIRNKRFMDEGNKKGRSYFKEDNPARKKEFKEKIRSSLKRGWKEGKYELSGTALLSSQGLQGKDKHPNWLGGISFEPYDSNWDDNFRIGIRERDNYTCGICKRHGNCVHHIDYDKKNTTPENCITLCNSCHVKTNYNRQHWMGVFAK